MQKVACPCNIQKFSKQTADFIPAMSELHISFLALAITACTNNTCKTRCSKLLQSCSSNAAHKENLLLDGTDGAAEVDSRRSDRGGASCPVFKSPMKLDFSSSMCSSFCCRQNFDEILEATVGLDWIQPFARKFTARGTPTDSFIDYAALQSCKRLTSRNPADFVNGSLLEKKQNVDY